MATLQNFLRTGQLGPIRLGIDPFEASLELGDPDGRSRKANPLELKYGALRLTFWKHSGGRKPQLMEIGLYYQPISEPLPEAVTLTDVNLSGLTTESEFQSFLRGTDTSPVAVIGKEPAKAVIFPSGATVSFSDGRLHSLKISQQQTKEGMSIPLSDEREPSIEQIEGMLAEARTVAETGALRSGLVLAWAGLEAVLRRVAMRAGMLGRIGVQPAILIRELYSAKLLKQDEVNFLEEARQVRTGVAHGLAAEPVRADVVVGIIDFATRLLAADGLDASRSHVESPG